MVQGWCNTGFHKYLLHRKQNMTGMLWLLHRRCLVMARRGNQRNGRNRTKGEILSAANIQVKDTYGMGFARPSLKSERNTLVVLLHWRNERKSFLQGRMQYTCFNWCAKMCFEVDLNHWHKDFQSFALTPELPKQFFFSLFIHGALLNVLSEGFYSAKRVLQEETPGRPAECWSYLRTLPALPTFNTSPLLLAGGGLENLRVLHLGGCDALDVTLTWSFSCISRMDPQRCTC